MQLRNDGGNYRGRGVLKIMSAIFCNLLCVLKKYKSDKITAPFSQFSKRPGRLIGIIRYVYIEKKNFLQNQQANFNQTWQKSSLGKGNSKLF